ncbi:PH domain-containing protein [Xanthomonas melonis]|uniref:PH domain-containing protein n=1 Tax=Xanthomonas melonis TaxID=56456 RepID=A0ABS8NSM1_9XANT|nr:MULTISPECIES: PH domain-containing protein [Xanthomonas]MCC4585931.1 PH domain-containing protein [Xanthomonas sp. NCPPB 1067]MCD0257850.1 PH domain-containing protein [Xanthomonas melonis]MCD0266069.1 PH domain-containing protein [Xanthomonas melonis]MCD0279388.1 PH domain-containing protein [Xanthomonas melonis]
MQIGRVPGYAGEPLSQTRLVHDAPPPHPDILVRADPVQPPALDHARWQQLPRRGAYVAAVNGALGGGCAALIAAAVIATMMHVWRYWPVVLGVMLAAAALGAWLAVKRHRLTLWKLDQHGLALQRGHLWQSDTRVPISRVQHVDLRRGPIERATRLTTLVVHTAGSRLNAVALSGLDQADAERLRDRLARQLDHHDDAL